MSISHLGVVILMVSANIHIFVMLLGGVIPRAKKVSSSKRENLDNFLHQMDNSSLVCLNAFWHCAYRQECLLVCAPSKGSLIMDKVPAFLCTTLAESGICQLFVR